MLFEFLDAEARLTLEVAVREEGNICNIRLTGRLVSGAPVKQLEGAVQTALERGQIFLILDIAGVPYIDSSGMGSMVLSLKASQKAGGSTKLVKPASFVEEMLKITNLLPLFAVYQTETEAIAACGE
jgi:anti-sigma B factor antagonist